LKASFSRIHGGAVVHLIRQDASQRLTDISLIVDNKHLGPADVHNRELNLQGSWRGLVRLPGEPGIAAQEGMQFNDEARPSREIVFYTHSAVMFGDDAANNGQAQSRAARFG